MKINTFPNTQSNSIISCTPAPQCCLRKLEKKMPGPGTGNHIMQKGKRIPEWQRIRITAIQRAKEDPPRLQMKQGSKIEERSLKFSCTDDLFYCLNQRVVNENYCSRTKQSRKKKQLLSPWKIGNWVLFMTWLSWKPYLHSPDYA